MALSFGFGSLIDASDTTEGGEGGRPTAVFVYQMNSLVVSYKDDRQEEKLCPKDRLPPPWRLNLVASSRHFQFLAARDVILVQRITSKGLEPYASLRPQIPQRTVDGLVRGDADDDGEEESEQYINSIRVGQMASRVVLVSVDTLAAVNVWDAHTLECISAFFVSQSAWSIAFDPSSNCILIGNNAWEITSYSLSSLSIQGRAVEHTHNIPALDADDRVQVSASIDGTCHIRKMHNGNEVQIIDIGSWCWTCTIIRVNDVEPCSIFGQEHDVNTRIAYLCRTGGAAEESQPLMESDYDADLGDSGNDIDYEDFLVDQEADYLDESYEDGEVEVRQLASENYLEPMSEESWDGNDETQFAESVAEQSGRQQSTQLFFSGTLHGGPRTLGRYDGENATLNYYEQTGQMNDVFLSGEEIRMNEDPVEDFVALTTAHDLYLVRLRDGSILLKHGLSQLMGTSVRGRVPSGIQFNRFCMSQWVMQLSCLFLGNQAGYLVIYHFLREVGTNHLTIRSVLIDPTPTAPMAGFSVFEQPVDEYPKISRRLWYLYVLYLDGRKLLVQIERFFNQELDLTRLHLS